MRIFLQELGQQIEDYSKVSSPDEQMEWSLILGEIRAFIDADNAVNVLDMDSNTIVLSHRLSTHCTPPVEKTITSNYSLQEILIIGNCNDQVKFSELTIDMFRMLQTLERESLEDVTQIFDNSPGNGKVPYQNGDSSNVGIGMCSLDGNMVTPGVLGKRENPHKYLLFKPTFSQLQVFLSSGFKELPANGVMLVYLSANGSFVKENSSNKHQSYDCGGVFTCSKRETDGIVQQKSSSDSKFKELHCIYPGDLYPFTRKPLFLIVDSDNSVVFANMTSLFGQPLVVLMSPVELPLHYQQEHGRGSLFTLFLHCPLMGLCVICSVCDVPMLLWERCQALIDRFMVEASILCSRSKNLDPTYLKFFCDDFLRLILLRYMFCCTVLQSHRAFKSEAQLPSCFPPIPKAEFFNDIKLNSLVMEIAQALEVTHLFAEMARGTTTPTVVGMPSAAMIASQPPSILTSNHE